MDKNILILLAVTLLGLAAAFILPPLPQPAGYHRFADGRRLLGIPNCLDVLSNLPFCIVGLAGLYCVIAAIDPAADGARFFSYLTFFAGLFLTGLGSGWYHLNPDNESLVWDRLPMTVAFAGFFSSVLSELVSPRWGLRLLVPLLLLGLYSVLHWIVTERKGRGDLRPYLIVQFLPMLLIPVILWRYDGGVGYKAHIVGLLGFYGLAKLFESLDGVIYSRWEIVSGHTLKHLAAAAGAASMVLLLMERTG